MKNISSLFQFIGEKLQGMFWGISIKNDNSGGSWTSIAPSQAAERTVFKLQTANSNFLKVYPNSTDDGIIIDTAFRNAGINGATFNAGIMTSEYVKRGYATGAMRGGTTNGASSSLTANTWKSVLYATLPTPLAGYSNVTYRIIGSTVFNGPGANLGQYLHLQISQNGSDLPQSVSESWFPPTSSGYSGRSVIGYVQLTPSSPTTTVYLRAKADAATTVTYSRIEFEAISWS